MLEESKTREPGLEGGFETLMNDLSKMDKLMVAKGKIQLAERILLAQIASRKEVTSVDIDGIFKLAESFQNKMSENARTLAEEFAAEGKEKG